MSTALPRFEPDRRRAVTVALVLVTALAAFEGTVVSTAMPTIIGELHGLPLYSWVFTAYLLASTVTMPLFGRLADIHGRRRILLVAITMFVAGAGACAAAQTMPQLIAARALQGLGAGGLLPTALTVSGDLFSIEQRARVQGLFSAVWGIASLAGPVLGAGLTLAFGWRSVFSINLPLGILAPVMYAGMTAVSAALYEVVEKPMHRLVLRVAGYPPSARAPRPGPGRVLAPAALALAFALQISTALTADVTRTEAVGAGPDRVVTRAMSGGADGFRVPEAWLSGPEEVRRSPPLLVWIDDTRVPLGSAAASYRSGHRAHGSRGRGPAPGLTGPGRRRKVAADHHQDPAGAACLSDE